MATISMSTLLEVLTVLSAVEKQMQPDHKNTLWYPVMAARSKLQAELGQLGVEVRLNTPAPQPLQETPT